MRISRSSESLFEIEDSMAARYQRLENPRIFSSSGITSSVVPCWIKRGPGIGGTLVGNEETRYGSSHKDEFRQ